MLILANAAGLIYIIFSTSRRKTVIKFNKV